MNVKYCAVALVTLLFGTYVQARYVYERAGTVEIKKVVLYENDNSYHGYMKQLAANPCLGNSPQLTHDLINYINHASSSEKHEILRILARNPSACCNEQLAYLVQQEIQYQQEKNAFEAAFSCAALVCIAVGTFIYSFIHHTQTNEIVYIS